ncbi:radical SAM protein [Roseospira marina]|uniref:Radical SAM protein n=1 Tax=Roseospira marina TaxID=140057 RepID=A0A5M6I5W2_9PROT|nr:radical SAM protein [Roseospira marina]KAA5603225.1 radical SAM protein [Roseospira marina]MBB4316201.1 MoaA/NifB/PqqE/SkfB family radical SAM enzyme [Roseospira marina]MBB5089399.1 MoaA/NifB/PqqE/SkfB family radical SAM enzyme [Roseospira marina]
MPHDALSGRPRVRPDAAPPPVPAPAAPSPGAQPPIGTPPIGTPSTGHPLIGMFDHELQAPLSILLELTRRCNLHCRHCFSNSGAQDQTPELSTQEWFAVIDRLAAHGVFLIFFGGGEPLCRTDLPAIAERARGHGMDLCLLSNLTPVTPAIARRLKDIGFYKVEGNLDGATAEVYEALRVTPGSFARSLAGIRNCVEVGLPLRINCTLTRLNAEHMEAVAALACDLGVTDLAFLRLIEAGRGGDNFDSLDVGEAVYRAELLPRLKALRQAYAGHMDIGYEQDEEIIRACDPNQMMPWCGAGRIHCTVTPDGKVKPDHSFPDDDPRVVAGNVRERDIIDIWRTAPLFQTLRHTRFARCARCRHVACTGGDAFRIYTHYGAVMGGPDPRCLEMEATDA